MSYLISISFPFRRTIIIAKNRVNLLTIEAYERLFRKKIFVFSFKRFYDQFIDDRRKKDITAENQYRSMKERENI